MNNIPLPISTLDLWPKLSVMRFLADVVTSTFLIDLRLFSVRHVARVAGFSSVKRDNKAFTVFGND